VLRKAAVDRVGNDQKNRNLLYGADGTRTPPRFASPASTRGSPIIIEP